MLILVAFNILEAEKAIVSYENRSEEIVYNNEAYFTSYGDVIGYDYDWYSTRAEAEAVGKALTTYLKLYEKGATYEYTIGVHKRYVSQETYYIPTITKTYTETVINNVALMGFIMLDFIVIAIAIIIPIKFTFAVEKKKEVSE